MKASLALALAGAVLLAGALPARADQAGQTPPPAQSHATARDFAAQKDAYLKDMHRRMVEWGKKIDRYSKEATAQGQSASKDADKEMHRAWIKTKDASRRLVAATRTGWARAKAAFERASDKMNHEWQEHKPQ